MNAILIFFAHRLREPSTYVGLILAAAGTFGITLDQYQAAQLAGACAVIAGLVLTAIKERKSKDHKSHRNDAAPVDPPVVHDDSGQADVPPRDPSAEPPRIGLPQGGARTVYRDR